MGMPETTSGGGPIAVWWCPLTIASTFPATASAMRWISLAGGNGPACAVRTTTVAPRARSASASCAAIGPPGRKSRSATIRGFVTQGVSTVVRPMKPTFRPRTSRSAEGLAQTGRSWVPFLKMLAARMGYFASFIRSISAGIPKSNSWFPTAAAATPSALKTSTTDLPWNWLEMRVPWNSEDSKGVGSRK